MFSFHHLSYFHVSSTQIQYGLQRKPANLELSEYYDYKHVSG